MIWTFAWIEIRRRKTRTLLTVLATCVSIALLVGVLSISAFFRRAVTLPFTASGADMVVETFTEPGPWNKVRLARHLGLIPDRVLEQLRQLPQVTDATGSLHLWSWSKPKMTNVAGIDPGAQRLTPVGGHPALHWEGKPCCSLTAGRLMQQGDRGVAILDKAFSDKTGIGEGDTIRLPEEPFRVIGVADFRGLPRAAQAEVFIPLADAQQLLGQPGMVNMIMLKLTAPEQRSVVGREVKRIVSEATGLPPEAVKVLTPETILADTTGVATLTQLTMKTIAIVVVAAVFLLLIKVTLAAVSERTGEIGVMKAVGWDSGKVARLITLESALQAFMGGLLGCALGYLVAFAYAATVEMNLPHGLVPYSCVPAAAPPSNLVVAMRVSPTLVAAALGLALVLGVLSGCIGARHAARLEPAEALRRM